MNIGGFSIRNGILATMLMVFVVVFGLVSVKSIQKEVLPPIDLNYITVFTIYPGASALDMERIVTAPIEEAIQSVNGIQKISSSSLEGISSILCELRTDADKNNVYADLKSAVDKIQDLPSDVVKPEVTKIDINVPIIQVSLSSKVLSERQVHEYARRLSERLKDIPGVQSVNKIGYRNKEIWVEVDPNKLLAYNVGLSQVINSIKMRNIGMPGGTVNENGRDFIVKTTGEIKEADEVSRIVLRANDAGNMIPISAVSTITETFKKKTLISKTMGVEDISLVVLKKPQDDALSIVKRVKKTVAEYKKEYAPKDLEIQLVNDTTPRIRSRLETLGVHGGLGFLLVMIILFIFLNPRVAFLTSLSIPFSFLMTFLVMSWMGMSMNMISLFALILVLGMIVDQAIIVSENVYRNLETGMAPLQAVEVGTNEVVMPVISSVATTIAAFFPLLLIPGAMGKFIHDIPMVVIIALLASMVQAFFVLPSNLASQLRPVRKSPENPLPKAKPQSGGWTLAKIIRKVRDSMAHAGEEGGSGWYREFLAFYTRILKWFLKRRKLFTGLAVVALVLSVILGFKVMKFEFVSSRGIEKFTVVIKMKNNASLEVTERETAKVEQVILGLPKNELEEIITRVGADSIQEGIFADKDSDLAAIQVTLTEEKYRKKRNADAIIADLKKKTQGISEKIESITFSKQRSGPSSGKPVNIEIQGDNYALILHVANQVKEIIAKNVPGVYDLNLSYKEGKEELRVVIDDRKAAMTGVSVMQAATVIRTAFEGMKASSIRRDGEVIEIIVRFDERYSMSLDNLMKIQIPNQMGQLIPLSAIASFSKEKSIKRVERIGLKRTITVYGEIDNKKSTSRKANAQAKKLLKPIMDKNPEIKISFTGEETDTRQSFSSFINAFMMALFLIFIILAISFKSFLQPVTIMSTIPFGIMGIILALFLHGMPMGFFQMMGVIALAGVIVHDGILMIDFINREREAGKGLEDAIVSGAQKRLRPIILTAGTAAIGLFPMAYGIGGHDPMLQPLAIAFMWGLIFGTFLTLVLIPNIYMILEEVQNKASAIKKKWNVRFGGDPERKGAAE